MYALVAPARSELIVKNSRFVAEVFPVTTQAQAREELHRIKSLYADATHVVHAFVTGVAGEVNGMSDDGEPSGTAGRPVLDVLKGSGITNILLTVTRYFGGTLLGTGGLVRAYGDSAKAVLSVCSTEQLVQRARFLFTTDYASYESIKRQFCAYHVDALDEQYATGVTVCGTIFAAEAERFSVQISNMTRGRTEVTITPCT